MSWKFEGEHPFGRDRVIRAHVLDNGLRLLHVPDHAAPIVSYQTWFDVGSRCEQPGRTGMAHLFEHLMFNQTANLAPGELDRMIESVGGDTNAATWVDWTYYRCSVPARELELAVRVEADRMQNLTLDDEQLEAEREVVINERLMRVDDDVDGFLDEQLMKLAFETHPYHWPTIGWMEDIRAIAKPDVHAFYRTYYAPNNATVVVVGDAHEDGLLDLMARYYGDIAAAEIPTRTAPPEPAQTSERRVSFGKPVSSARVLLGYKAPAQSDPDWAAMELLGALLTGSPSARLEHTLVVEREAATSVDGYVLPFRDPSLFELSIAATREFSATEVLAIVDDELARMRDERVADRELAKVKSGVETEFWTPLATCDGKAEALGHYQTALGDYRALFDMADAVHAVTTDDIARVAARYLDPSQRTVVIAEPAA